MIQLYVWNQYSILCKLYLNRKILISRSDVYFDFKLEKNFEGYTQLYLPLPSQ